jgi:hypothetical protein
LFVTNIDKESFKIPSLNSLITVAEATNANEGTTYNNAPKISFTDKETKTN